MCAGLRIVTARWFAPAVAALAGAACTFVFLPVGPALHAADVLTFLAAQGLTLGRVPGVRRGAFAAAG